MKAMENMDFTYMTEIQKKTGSDKTFLIPAIELIYRWKFMPYNERRQIIFFSATNTQKITTITSEKRFLLLFTFLKKNILINERGDDSSDHALLMNNEYILQLHSYYRAYYSHHLKQIFDIKTLDLAKVAKSFGFTVSPIIGLNLMLNFHFFLFNSLIEVEISKSSRSQKETQRRRKRGQDNR
ncbi:putative ATP-dependent RNA helicase pitchoune [Atta colombica]|uniref:Putative ATP-dependent RNA helicase pitchoune n=1 Tax=Atta colombica TaxID=520822 RepID=A0A195B802_9HYME|nr:putative ATP-dependent RNA helicase pitchoune [Atta colombica]